MNEKKGDKRFHFSKQFVFFLDLHITALKPFRDGLDGDNLGDSKIASPLH
jgi:hypothetical protein